MIRRPVSPLQRWASPSARGPDAVSEVSLPIKYKGEPLRLTYHVDFICLGDVLVEVKALNRLSGVEESQIINYLRLSGKRRALLINFGATRLEHRRFVC